MPHSIQKEGSFLRVSFRGHVTLRDLEGALRDLAAAESAQLPVPDRVIDLSAAEESDLKLADLLWAAEQRRPLRFPNPYRAAVIAPRPAQYGYARMFQILSNHPEVQLRAFRDEAEALAWLAAK